MIAAMKRLAFGLSFAAMSIATPALAQGDVIVQCDIVSGGRPAFSGRCVFVPDGTSGSFGLLSTRRDAPLFGRILSVGVTIVSPGVAEVRGLTTDGINSRWGEARRHAERRACWQGADFMVCAQRLDPAAPERAAPPAAGEFPRPAKSWGGIVRSGPGMNFAPVAILQEREPIVLLGRAEAPERDGYPWFRIRYRGQVGYQWGGIVCATGGAFPGTFQVCD
jgi:hypothetical protein